MAWASVFMRHYGAGYNGHVGWAFETRPGVSIIGAVENPMGQPIVLPSLKGQWHAEVSNNQILHYIRNLNPNYQSYKKIWVPSPNPNAAIQKMRSWENKPYLVLLQNCNNATFDILTAYGVPHLPNYKIGQPQVWYEKIQHAEQYVNNRTGTSLQSTESDEEDPYKEMEEKGA